MTSEKSMERALMVRTYEASCKIPCPTALEMNFRISLMKAIGVAFGLREMRAVTISGPSAEPKPGGTPGARGTAK